MATPQEGASRTTVPEQRKTKWDRAVEISQVVVAVCALLGVGLALFQNKQTAQLFNAAGESFSAQAYPVIQFEEYQWNTTEKGPSCEIPALGFNTYIRNRSGVPVAMESTNLHVYMGERLIDIGPEVSVGRESETILAPGVRIGAFGFTHATFPDIYKRLQGMTQPQLSFVLDIKYRSLISGVRYQYEVKVTMLEDCRLPNQRNFAKRGEVIRVLTDQPPEIKK